MVNQVTPKNAYKALLKGPPIPLEVQQWLSDALNEDALEGKSKYIQLPIRRQTTPRDRRDMCLLRAFECLPDASVNQRIDKLHGEIKLFCSAVWCAIGDKEKPDPAWSKLRHEIFEALQCKAGLPDRRQLENIIRNNLSL